ncbi:MAG: DUF3873 domain-containing protein [Oscillospiraceae bacterium]
MMLDPKNLNNGEEQYERFKRRGKNYVQYDYRDTDGKLFSTVKPTLDECRTARNEWLKSREGTAE